MGRVDKTVADEPIVQWVDDQGHVHVSTYSYYKRALEGKTGERPTHVHSVEFPSGEKVYFTEKKGNLLIGKGKPVVYKKEGGKYVPAEPEEVRVHGDTPQPDEHDMYVAAAEYLVQGVDPSGKQYTYVYTETQGGKKSGGSGGSEKKSGGGGGKSGGGNVQTLQVSKKPSPPEPAPVLTVDTAPKTGREKYETEFAKDIGKQDVGADIRQAWNAFWGIFNRRVEEGHSAVKSVVNVPVLGDVLGTAAGLGWAFLTAPDTAGRAVYAAAHDVPPEYWETSANMRAAGIGTAAATGVFLEGVSYLRSVPSEAPQKVTIKGVYSEQSDSFSGTATVEWKDMLGGRHSDTYTVVNTSPGRIEVQLVEKGDELTHVEGVRFRPSVTGVKNVQTGKASVSPQYSVTQYETFQYMDDSFYTWSRSGVKNIHGEKTGVVLHGHGQIDVPEWARADLRGSFIRTNTSTYWPQEGGIDAHVYILRDVETSPSPLSPEGVPSPQTLPEPTHTVTSGGGTAQVLKGVQGTHGMKESVRAVTQEISNVLGGLPAGGGEVSVTQTLTNIAPAGGSSLAGTLTRGKGKTTGRTKTGTEETVGNVEVPTDVSPSVQTGGTLTVTVPQVITLPSLRTEGGEEEGEEQGEEDLIDTISGVHEVVGEIPGEGESEDTISPPSPPPPPPVVIEFPEPAVEPPEVPLPHLGTFGPVPFGRRGRKLKSTYAERRNWVLTWEAIPEVSFEDVFGFGFGSRRRGRKKRRRKR